MNPTDFCLERLFRAAARAPRDLPAEAPFPLEREVMNAWRRGPAQSVSALLMPLARGAIVCAYAILLISAALTLTSTNDAPGNELVTVDSVIQLTLLK